MKTRNGETITLTDRYRHKFGDALAEYVYCCGEMYTSDEQYSDSDFGQYYTRVAPRKILAGDSQGFVDLHRFATVAECDAAWAEIGERFAQFWSDSDED